MKYFLPRFQDILFLSLFCGAMLLGNKMLGIDSDLGRHLVIGEYILNHGEIPTTNIFSYTKPGESRPPYEWLSQTLFAVAYRFLGLDGIILLASLLISISFTLVYVDGIQRSGMLMITLLLTILSAIAGSIHWLPRPHVFTFLFLAIWLERLERLYSEEKIPLWQFPALMLIWANLHGGFVFGLLALAAYITGWIAERWIKNEEVVNKTGKKLMLIGILSIVASCITPDGWGNWQALLGNSSKYILNQTIETMPPNFHQVEMIPFLVLIFITLLVIVLNGSHTPISHLFLAAGFVSLGLLMARNIPLFGIVVSPILATVAYNILNKSQNWMRFESRLGKVDRSLSGFTWAFVGVLLILFLFIRYHLQTGSNINNFDPHVFPVRAVDWLEENPQKGNMFNEFNWGGYLLFRLFPNQLVFIDSQTDFYGEALVRDYSQIISTENDWVKKLDEFKIEWVIVKSGSALAQSLESQYHWRVLYQDETAIVLRR